MNTVLRSDEFDVWLAAMTDSIGRARVMHRIRSGALKMARTLKE